MVQSGTSILAVSVFVRLCASQESGWIAGQINTTMCYWMNPRSAVVRDTLYIDGGYLWWKPGMSDGTYGGYLSDGNPLGLVYRLNFSTPFAASQNLSTTFTVISKASGGGAANNIGPNYYDGAMFANDYEWLTYGGLLAITDTYKPPAGDAIAAYEVYASGPSEKFQPGYILDQLPEGTTRYVTDGAAVSVPSENLGFYFGGLRAASSGPIYYLPSPVNETLNGDQLSLTLIELDMAIEQQQTWKNHTLPSEIPGRASAEIVWVPVSKKGILVAIGGVIYPAYANVNQKNNASANAASQQQSPAFMSTVAIYDIATQTWYQQDTTGAPGALAQGCAVLASARDGSSHNIYWYGGFDGLHLTGDFSDDVWVLSLPSFRWTKVFTGTASHARAGHRCTKPYPDQMMVIGGYGSFSGGQPKCLDGMVQIFNLSSAEWVNSYDPNKWSNYTVPSVVYQMIGGTATGGATRSLPSPSGFTNDTMAALFSATYNTSKVKNWHPYAASPTASESRTTLLPTSVVQSSGTSKYLAPALGVIVGFIFLSAIIFSALFWLWRQRRLSTSRTSADRETAVIENRFCGVRWIRRQNEELPTTATGDVPGSQEREMPAIPKCEMSGESIVYEMGHPGPAELPGEFGKVQDEGVTTSDFPGSATVSPLTPPPPVRNPGGYLDSGLQK